MNNQDWLKDLGLLDFLQSAGAHVRLNTMLARERCFNRFHSLNVRLMRNSASGRVSSHRKVYLSQNLRISSYKHTTSYGYSKTKNAPSKLAAPINGGIYCLVWK